MFLAFRHYLGDVYKRAQKDVGVIDEEDSPEEDDEETDEEAEDDDDEGGQGNA